jgi:hypothetical protein
VSGTDQPDSPEVYVAAAAVRETLGRATDVDACVALVRRTADLLGSALEYFRAHQAGIACQAGCSFCCHLRVMVYPHEAIALFRHLGSALPGPQAQLVRERLRSNAARLRQAPAGPAARLACAFLVDGQCSVYEVRPGACAGHHSLGRGACESDHRSPPGMSESIPVSQALAHVAAGLGAGLDAGLREAGLSHSRVELQTAVAALLEEPALIARWRSGREWPRMAGGVLPGK